MRRIPEKDKRLMQVPQTDVLGNINASYNLDLTSNYGKIRVGNALIPNTTSSALTFGDTTSNIEADIDLATGFAYLESTTPGRENFYATCSGKVYKAGAVGGQWTNDTVTGTPTVLDYRADIINFNDKLYVLDDKLYALGATGDWSSIAFTGDGAGGTMAVYGNRLYLTAGSKVFSMNTSETVATSGAYTLQLPSTGANDITSVEASSDRLWVATTNGSNGQGVVYEWDGVTENVTNREIVISSSGALAMVIKDDIPWILDAEGVLRQYNGGRFAERARLPKDPNLFFDGGLIQRNGMTVHGGKILILVKTELADGSYDPVMPSGIWEFDENIGLYHKHSLGYTNNYGQVSVLTVGALISSREEETTGGNLAVGAEVAGNIHGIWFDDVYHTEDKSGYLITTKIESNSIQDIWQKVWCKYKEAATIVVKYRVEEAEPDTFNITWTDGNTFTSTGDLSGYAVGDEVEVISGQGGISHITAISASAGTYTVDVDETVTGLTGSAGARLSKWKKAGTMTSGTYDELPLGIKGNWIQLKIVMYFSGNNEIEEIIIDNQIDK